LLIETARVLATAFLGADVRFTADLRPDFRIGLDRQIAERSIARGARPFGELLEFAPLRAGKKFLFALQRALEPPGTKVILSALHQRRLKFDRQHFFQDRNIFINQLFLKIDCVCRNEGLLVSLEGEEDRRNQVSQRFAHTGASLNDQMLFVFQRLRHACCHLLLLRPEFEICCFRQRTGLGKEAAYPVDEFAAERIFKRDHAQLRTNDEAPAFAELRRGRRMSNDERSTKLE
jgi:hypothetical protein